MLAPYENRDALEVARNLDRKVEDILQQAAACAGTKGGLMSKNHQNNASRQKVSVQPRLHQRADEIQAYGTVNHLLPLDLEEPVRLEMTAQLNQLLAGTMTLRDLV